MRLPRRHHSEKSDAELGFDHVMNCIGSCIEWAFYIVFFPIHYPLSLLGKRKRVELDAADPPPGLSVEQFLAQARKRK